MNAKRVNIAEVQKPKSRLDMKNEQQTGGYRVNDVDVLVSGLFSGGIVPSQRTESIGMNPQ